MNGKLRMLMSRLIGLFFVLMLLRLLYGYTLNIPSNGTSSGIFDSLTDVRKNYASKEYSFKKGTHSSEVSLNVDQKFEKIASILSRSSNFKEEEKSARAAIVKHNALIQFEQKYGNDGKRKLQLLIGVPPENFDSLYGHLVTIGTVNFKQITKKDKTNEYKELNSKKASLDKVRSSLIDLKGKSGKIEEFINLENRILDIEQQLQNLGVSLGDFDSENEFCTVKFSLSEEEIAKVSLAHRLKVAFEWTVEFYLMILGILTFMVVGSYFALLILDKLKVFDKLK